MPRSRKPPNRPEYFIDRSLGRHQLRDALAASGRIVHTMRSVYGPGVEEEVSDEIWLQDAGQREWLVLTKDDRIRRRPAELDAIVRFGVRVACLTNASLTGPQQVQRIMANINRIDQRWLKPGPWIVAVHERSLTQIWPAAPPSRPPEPVEITRKATSDPDAPSRGQG